MAKHSETTKTYIKQAANERLSQHKSATELKLEINAAISTFLANKEINLSPDEQKILMEYQINKMLDKKAELPDKIKKKMGSENYELLKDTMYNTTENFLKSQYSKKLPVQHTLNTLIKTNVLNKTNRSPIHMDEAGFKTLISDSMDSDKLSAAEYHFLLELPQVKTLQSLLVKDLSKLSPKDTANYYQDLADTIDNLDETVSLEDKAYLHTILETKIEQYFDMRAEQFLNKFKDKKYANAHINELLEFQTESEKYSDYYNLPTVSKRINDIKNSTDQTQLLKTQAVFYNKKRNEFGFIPMSQESLYKIMLDDAKRYIGEIITSPTGNEKEALVEAIAYQLLQETIECPKISLSSAAKKQSKEAKKIISPYSPEVDQTRQSFQRSMAILNGGDEFLEYANTVLKNKLLTTDIEVEDGTLRIMEDLCKNFHISYEQASEIVNTNVALPLLIRLHQHSINLPTNETEAARKNVNEKVLNNQLIMLEDLSGSQALSERTKTMLRTELEAAKQTQTKLVALKSSVKNAALELMKSNIDEISPEMIAKKLKASVHDVEKYFDLPEVALFVDLSMLTPDDIKNNPKAFEDMKAEIKKLHISEEERNELTSIANTKELDFKNSPPEPISQPESKISDSRSSSIASEAESIKRTGSESSIRSSSSSVISEAEPIKRTESVSSIRSSSSSVISEPESVASKKSSRPVSTKSVAPPPPIPSKPAECLKAKELLITLKAETGGKNELRDEMTTFLTRMSTSLSSSEPDKKALAFIEKNMSALVTLSDSNVSAKVDIEGRLQQRANLIAEISNIDPEGKSDFLRGVWAQQYQAHEAEQPALENKSTVTTSSSADNAFNEIYSKLKEANNPKLNDMGVKVFELQEKMNDPKISRKTLRDESAKLNMQVNNTLKDGTLGISKEISRSIRDATKALSVELSKAPPVAPKPKKG